MAHAFTPWKTAALAAALSSADLRMVLVMSNTTADTEEDAETIGDLTTLDEYDGANYTQGVGTAVASETYNEDDANDRGFLDFADVAFVNLGAGTRSCVGYLLIDKNATFALSPLVMFQDQGGFPFNANGSTVTVQISPTGAIGLT